MMLASAVACPIAPPVAAAHAGASWFTVLFTPAGLAVGIGFQLLGPEAGVSDHRGRIESHFNDAQEMDAAGRVCAFLFVGRHPPVGDFLGSGVGDLGREHLDHKARRVIRWRRASGSAAQ